MSRLKRIWDNHFLGLELAVSILIGIVFMIWVTWLGGSATVNSIVSGNRSAIYGTLASVFGALLGFVITALSIIIGYSTNEKLAFLRKSKHYPTLWKVLLSTIKVLGLATLAMLLGLILDRDNPPKLFISDINIYPVLLVLSRFFSICTTLLSIFRLKNCIWVFENVVRIVIGI